MSSKYYIIFIFGCLFSWFISFNVMAEELTPQLCKEKVDAAVEFLKIKGAAGYSEIRNSNGMFRFAGSAGYVWVQDMDAVMIVHPIKPELEGRGLMNQKDINGLYLFIAFTEMVEEYGAGWVPYLWPKPGETSSSFKISYVRGVIIDGISLLVGSGIYDVLPSDIKKLFPADPIYHYRNEKLIIY